MTIFGTHVAGTAPTAALTLALALILQVSPWPQPLTIIRDAWVPLVLFYWVLAEPERINVGTGFILGLLWDAELGGVLGVRALALSLLSYCTAINAPQLRPTPLVQQATLITLAAIITHGLILGIECLILSTAFPARSLWAHALDGLLWAGFSLITSHSQQKTR